MNNDESILVICAFIFAITLYAVVMVRGPRLGIINRKVFFDKSKLPNYFRFLALVALLSVPFGYLVARQISLALEFAGLNVLIGVIMGVNLFLYRRRA